MTPTRRLPIAVLLAGCASGPRPAPERMSASVFARPVDPVLEEAEREFIARDIRVARSPGVYPLDQQAGDHRGELHARGSRRASTPGTRRTTRIVMRWPGSRSTNGIRKFTSSGTQADALTHPLRT
jgi:hypothetical protein